MEKRTFRFGAGALVAAVGALTIACGGQDAVSQQDSALGAGAPAYLALGDSVPFGLDPLIVPPPNDNVFVGYPEYLGEILDVPLENAACPGETTASFTSLDAARTGTAMNCAGFKASGWLHADYRGTQVDYALEFLHTHPRVRLVTIALGANDLFDLQAACTFDAGCILAGLPAVQQTIRTRMNDILGALRQTGYAGRIVVPLYYSPSPDPLVTGAVLAMNQALVGVDPALGAGFVDVQAAFLRESAPFGNDPCAAGLVIPLPGGGCDAHPTTAGAQLIAAEIARAVAPPTVAGVSTTPTRVNF
jgi:lysophospholipase L1-like esterase